MNILDEKCNFHRSPDLGVRHTIVFHFSILNDNHLSPDGGDPVLVAQQGVHVHAVLDHQGRDWNQRKYLQQQSTCSKRSLYCTSMWRMKNF